VFDSGNILVGERVELRETHQKRAVVTRAQALAIPHGVSMSIAIMGATGHTGRAIAESLINQGKKVRVLGRDAAKLTQIAGAEPFVGKASDAEHLTAAFTGATAAYILIPPNPVSPDFRKEQDATTAAIVSALKASGLKRVVMLSSLGAEVPAGTGPIAGLHHLEQALKKIDGLNALILRPTYFLENHFANLPMIKHMGINGGAIKGDVAFPQIATADIAVAAAAELAKPTATGHVVHELLGAADYTLADVTKKLGAAIGKPELPYTTFPYDAFSGALQQAGLSKSVSDLYAEMSKAFNDGIVKSRSGRNEKTTTKTSLDAFIPSLAAAFKAM
jgi:uncharacterized protein YbjT (DUF2867 family)